MRRAIIIKVVVTFIISFTCMLSLSLSAADDVADNQIKLSRHRFDYRDLGYWPANIVEPDESKITSLITDPVDGTIYGATSGKKAQVFRFLPDGNYVQPLGRLPRGQGVRNALALPGDGFLYLGTGKDMTLEPEISKDWGKGLGVNHILIKMWQDIEASYEGYQEGRIYRYDTSAMEPLREHANEPAPVQDLGVPVPGQGIYCMIASLDGGQLYGITYPQGKFFVFDIQSRQTRVVGSTWEKEIFAGPRQGVRSLTGQLILDEQGNCYFSSDWGRIARYNPELGKFEKFSSRVPGEYYPLPTGHGYDPYHSVVECWTAGRDNSLFGGTNDGFFFQFFPEKDKVVDLGKVRIARRVRTLSTGTDGVIYGMVGEKYSGCTLFSFDQGSRGFTRHGPLLVDRSPYYAWNPHQFEASTTGLDGTVYLGESDRKGHLYFFFPIGNR